VEGLSVVVLFFVVLVFVTIFLGVRIVPQGSKHVIQRLGKFHMTLGPGLNFIIPYIDTVAYKITSKDIVLDIPSQEVITKDNAVIVVNAVAYINVISPEKAVYGVEDYRLAIQNLVQTSLRSIIGEMNLDDALSSREKIKARLKENISDDIADWGIMLKTVEIQDISPSETMQKAMEEQAAAERARRATVTKAEGEKSAAILQAEGRLEASKLDARAKVVMAEGDQLRHLQDYRRGTEKRAPSHVHPGRALHRGAEERLHLGQLLDCCPSCVPPVRHLGDIGRHLEVGGGTNPAYVQQAYVEHLISPLSVLPLQVLSHGIRPLTRS
jgi:regulator of protease activity HflC (stomatin/prohibitin superfamily)